MKDEKVEDRQKAGLTQAMKPYKRKLFGSMFSSDDPTMSLIGECLSVLGELHLGNGVVRLDGQLEGKVIGEGTLIIGEKGSLQGEIKIDTLILRGRVEGKVLAKGRAHITPTGKLFGKIQASQLVIDHGGIFEGEGEARTLADHPPETGKDG
jgi:cytoskeletal protein CcmA (bactofilin family)